MARIRGPAVAGLFYEAEPEALRARLEWCFRHPLGPGKLPPKEQRGDGVAVIAPHAGYMYSCPIAAHAYYEASSWPKPETVVVIGPDHVGTSASVSVYPGGVWRTPLGELVVDEELAKAIAEESSIAVLDERPHLYDHSVEVQLPLIQYSLGAVKIVAVAVWDSGLDTGLDIAEAVYRASRRLSKRVLVVASLNLNQFMSREEVSKLDREVVNAIASLDPKKVYDVVARGDFRICNPAVFASIVRYAVLAGANKAQLLAYATSADIAGGDGSVASGYAAIAFMP